MIPKEYEDIFRDGGYVCYFASGGDLRGINTC